MILQKNEICVVIDDEEKKLVATDILKRAKEPIWSAKQAMDFDEECKFLIISDFGDWYVSATNKGRKETSLEELEQILNK